MLEFVYGRLDRQTYDLASEIVKLLQDGRKVVTSMWSFYNCFNISICKQTHHLGSAVNFNSCGNTKHMVMVKINFGIS